MQALSFLTSGDIQEKLAAFIRAQRKARRLSRTELAKKSTVPESTIKRFELTGEISLRQLLLLWECVADLGVLASACTIKAPVPRTIEEVLAS